MAEKKKKKFSIKETYSLNDIDAPSWTLITHELFDSVPLTKIQKTFKVKNYSDKIDNYILKNLEIEIEWIPFDSDEYWKNLSSVFK